MKKIFFGGLFLVAVGIGLIGCKKNEIQSPDSIDNLQKSITIEEIRGLEKIGSILSFETIDDYIEFIEDTSTVKWDKLESFANSQGFVNYFSQNLPAGLMDNDGMDELFGKLLNIDGVLLIGDYAVKIDLPEKSVYITHRNRISQNYNSLIIGDLSDKSIKAFSIDDDIIDYMIDGITLKCGGIGSYSDAAYSDNNNALVVMTVGSNQWRLNCGVNFFRAGVYFRLSATHEVWAGSTKINNLQNFFYVQVAVKNDIRFYRRRPCGSSNEITVSGTTFYNSNNGSHTKTFYDGTRNLNGYSFHVRARARYGDFTDSYWTPFGGRSINAPF